MRVYRELIIVVAFAALAVGCRPERLAQSAAGPTAQAAPPLADEDVSGIYAARHASFIPTDTGGGMREMRDDSPALRRSVIVATAVVLMPRLPVPDAAAIVLRRPKPWPVSVIMLEEDSLSLGAFESALFDLSYAVTRDGGVEAPLTPRMLQIHGQELPTGSNQAGRAMDQWILDTLKEAPRRTVAGVGAYRAVMLHIGTFIAAKPDSR